MSLYFVMPLSVAMIAGYYFKRCNDEMAFLSATTAIVSLLITIVIAPWQIQLCLLGVVLLSSRLTSSWRQTSPLEAVLGESSAASPIDPSYSRNYSSAPEATHIEIMGQYRGAPLKILFPKASNFSNTPE